MNKNEQVALIAVNILGDEIEKDTKQDGATSLENNIHNISPTLIDSNEPSLSSICDDLLFSMYVEESIADIIREMEQKKIKAVHDERFEYARKLKLCMTVLRNAGERLGRYSLAKRQAVQQEDFTTAKLRKEQIEMYKNSVLKHLLVEQLLEKDGINPENDCCSDLYASKPTLPAPPSLQDVATALSEAQFSVTMSPKSSHGDKSSTDGCSSIGGDRSQCQSRASDNHSLSSMQRSHEDVPNSPNLRSLGRSPNRDSPMSSRQGSLRRRNKSAPRNSYEDYEERAIPTLRQ